MHKYGTSSTRAQAYMFKVPVRLKLSLPSAGGGSDVERLRGGGDPVELDRDDQRP